MPAVSVPRRWVEAAVALALLLLISILAYMTLEAERRYHYQKALFFELQILRSAVNLYKVVNQENPPSLLALSTGVYHLGSEQVTHRYLDTSPVDADGVVRDPFGNPYHYETGTGWVRSASRGYEFW